MNRKKSKFEKYNKGKQPREVQELNCRGFSHGCFNIDPTFWTTVHCSVCLVDSVLTDKVRVIEGKIL